MDSKMPKFPDNKQQNFPLWMMASSYKAKLKQKWNYHSEIKWEKRKWNGFGERKTNCNNASMYTVSTEAETPLLLKTPLFFTPKGTFPCENWCRHTQGKKDRGSSCAILSVVPAQQCSLLFHSSILIFFIDLSVSNLFVLSFNLWWRWWKVLSGHS